MAAGDAIRYGRGRSGDPHGRSRLRPDNSVYRPQPRVRAAIGLGAAGPPGRRPGRARHAFGCGSDSGAELRRRDSERNQFLTANPMRKPVMAGNWKMYKTPAETQVFFEKFRPLAGNAEHCEVVICPPFTNLAAAVKSAEGTRIRIGAQNLHWAKDGAYTGEISAGMIKASGCSHVIIGHSERRQYFGETDESVLKKTVAALGEGLIPIVCVGERLEHREGGQTEVGLVEQCRTGICGLTAEQFARVII